MRGYKFLLISLFLIFLIKENSVYARGINIKVNESVVGNIYYGLVNGDGTLLNDGLEFELIDINGNVIRKGIVENSELIFMNVPFGEYYIKYKSYIYPVTIDKEYLKDQHIKKMLNLDYDFIDYTNLDTTENNEILPITGEENYSVGIAVFFVWLGLILFVKGGVQHRKILN